MNYQVSSLWNTTVYYCETLLCELYSTFNGKDFWKVKSYWIYDIKWLTDWVSIHRQYKNHCYSINYMQCPETKPFQKRRKYIYCYFTYSMLKIKLWLEFRRMTFLILCVALEHTHTHTHTHKSLQFSITVRILHFQERKEFLFLCPVNIVFRIGAKKCDTQTRLVVNCITWFVFCMLVKWPNFIASDMLT